MALVLSEQQNIDLLMLLVRLAIAIGAIAILLVLVFWLRLKKIEKRIYLMSKKPSKSRLVQPKPRRKTITKSSKRSGSSRWLWLLAIAIASITGIAIALMQLGSSFISPEFASLFWLLIGVMLVVSATFVKIA
jgi:hypothetical protein